MESEQPAPPRPEAERRVLLLAPTERDAQASRAVLGEAGIPCARCDGLYLLCEQIPAGAGAVIVPEEVLVADGSECLATAIRHQPVWSDLPVIVLSRAGMESPGAARAMSTLGNVTVIERPLRVTTLVSVVRTALRARERQYQIRDHLAGRERAERQLRAAKAEADEANRSKDQFLAALSHELRTPLSPVLMTVEVLASDPALPQRARDDLDVVRRNVELETKLIDDLLDVSRAASGKLQLRRETTSLHRLLEQVVTVCTSDQFTKQLRVVTGFGATVDTVRVDAARIQQVFWNILKNAIKFSGEGGEITLATEDAAAGRVRVLVRDRGAGVPPDVLPRLFNAFEQGDSGVTRRYGGLGLGLAISKAIVDLHGGSIRAESAGPGRGATFIVELDTTDAIPAQTPPAEPQTPGQRPAGLRILLVEDHADTAACLARILKALGHAVRTAHSVGAALRLAEEGPFDILISDIGLPDGTGYDLMREIKQRYGSRGLALSGYGMDEDLAKSRDAGFDEHLTKPVNLRALEAAMRRLTTAQTA